MNDLLTILHRIIRSIIIRHFSKISSKASLEYKAAMTNQTFPSIKPTYRIKSTWKKHHFFDKHWIDHPTKEDFFKLSFYLISE